MKKRIAIINCSLAIAVLFAILFQSFHSMEHLAKQLSEKHCHHERHSASEITHQHHGFDHCFVCEFTFSSFITPQTNALQSFISFAEIPYFFTVSETPVCFTGSSYSHRGPPGFIV